MKTAVMTDSNSGITPEEGKKIGIYSLPMPVIIEGDVFYEGKNITQEEYYGAMTSGKNVTTSQPSPGDVMDMWDSILKEGYEQVVYIPMSSGLSASCHAAIQLSEEYDGKVQVVDDHRISVTMRESVLEAKWMANQGMTAEEIKKRLEENAYNSSIYIAVDTLEYLKKGGRISSTKAAVGSLLNIKPILEVKDGLVSQVGQARGKKNVTNKMIECIKEELGDDIEQDEVYIGYSDDLKEREKLTEIAKEVFKPKKIEYFIVGTCIGAHSGPGVGGILVFKK